MAEPRRYGGQEKKKETFFSPLNIGLLVVVGLLVIVMAVTFIFGSGGDDEDVVDDADTEEVIEDDVEEDEVEEDVDAE